MTLPVFWTPEADADLKQARAWYGNIRPALGERFVLSVEASVEASWKTHCNFPSSIEDAGVQEYGVFLMAYSSRSKNTELLSSPAFMASVIPSAGEHADD